MLWWVLLVVCGLVFVVTMAALATALLRKRAPVREQISPGGGRSSDPVTEPPSPGGPDPYRLPREAEDRAVRWVLVAGAGIPALVLLGLFALTMTTLGRFTSPGVASELTVEVDARQYWWRVRYLEPVTAKSLAIGSLGPIRGAGGALSAGAPPEDTLFETANEIHVPVGRPVEVRLLAGDVIHSFWVPRLQGKLDMIPGRVNVTWLLAEEPGVYRGQCAEYCGVQHARMAFLVVAQPEEEFREWLRRQARPADAALPAPAAAPPEPGDAAGPDAPGPVPPETAPEPPTVYDSATAEAAARRAGEAARDTVTGAAADAALAGAGQTPGESADTTIDAQPSGAGGRSPALPEIRRGAAVFVEAGCAECHTIRGTAANGQAGPDLTHLASRRTLGAGTLPNTRGSLGGWVVNPHRIKPGNHMPPASVPAEDLSALLDFLMSLR